MGPSAPRDPRAPKAPDPLRAHLLKRNTGREVREWANDPGGPELMTELLAQPGGFQLPRRRARRKAGLLVPHPEYPPHRDLLLRRACNHVDQDPEYREDEDQ